MSAQISLGRTLRAPRGAAGVAGGSTATVHAAAQVLAQGGNAVDAAVAGMLAAAMAEPVLTSLGGGGFLLYAPAGQAPRYLDFFVDTPGLGASRPPTPMTPVTITFGTAEDPQAHQTFHAGWGSVAVPGCLEGYLQSHRTWGRLPLRSVAAPAIDIARRGLVLDPVQRDFVHLVRDVLAVTPDSAALYAGIGQGLPFRNPDYAELLEDICAADGQPPRPFVEALLGEMRTHGGLVTEVDVSSYAPVERVPLTMLRSDAILHTNPPPSSGGAIVLETIGVLAPRAPIAWGRVVQALREATERQRQRALAAAAAHASRGTTSISVVDSEGCLVTCTTSNGSSSGTQARGVQWNNMLGEEDLNPRDPQGAHHLGAGMRMGSMMTPTLVECVDGRRITFGSGGSERIRSAHVSVLLRLLDEDTDLATAVDAPRVHATATTVDVEPGITAASLAEAGIDPNAVRTWPRRDLFFGGVHAACAAADGSLEVVGDARRGGAAAVVLPG